MALEIGYVVSDLIWANWMSKVIHYLTRFLFLQCICCQNEESKTLKNIEKSMSIVNSQNLKKVDVTKSLDRT